MEWCLGRCRRFICYIIVHYIWHLLTICTCAVALLAAIATTMQVEGSVCHEVTDLKDLTHALMNISDWRSLGYELSVPHNTLESIDYAEKGIENKRRSVLRAWYNLQDHDPCWHSVTDVLRQLNQNHLATKIDQCTEYIQSGTDCDVTTCIKKGVNKCKFSYSISPKLLGLTAVLVLTAVCLYFGYTILEQATFTYQKQFARDSQATIKAKFADFQTKVCDKLVKNGVKIETFRLFVVNQFPPGEFIPPSPSSLFIIFETITHHGFWNYFHYSPLVKIVEKFGAGDSEMEDWVKDYRKDLKAYCIVTNVESYVETYLDNSPSAESTKHDIRYNQTMEWKTEFLDHSLQYLAEVWESFSSHYLVPDSPPTALLDRVRKGCFSVTWLVPSSLIPTLLDKVKIDTDFFQQHHIVRVTVGVCIYDEVVEKSTLIADEADDEQVNLEELGMLPVDKQWYSLGLALGVSVQELESIKKSERSLKNRKSKMFRVWIQNDSAPTLDKLHRALEEIDETDDASSGYESRRSSISSTYSETYSENGADQGEVKGEGGDLLNPETKDTKETVAQEWKGKAEEPKPKPLPARSKIHTWMPDEVVDLAIGESGIEAEKPITVGQLFKNAVERFHLHPALKYKEDGEWKTITYLAYYNCCIKAAKSFLKLGLEPYHGVCIIGFNSPEWVISNLGAMFAGSLPTGIYTTSKPEDCQFIAEDCKANIIVVENQKQLDKILEVRDRLPHLKAIVQYKGKLSQKYPNVYEWEEFLKLGDNLGIDNNVMVNNIMSQKPEQCALLIYTSGTTGKPNGVMLSHDNLTFTAKALKEISGQLEDGRECGLSYLPLSHISAQMSDIYLPLLVGATVYFAQPDALQGALGNTLREVQPTFFFGVPRVYQRIMEHVQEQEATTIGLRKRVFDWAKKRGHKGSLRMMESQSKPRGWGLANRMVLKSVHEALGFKRCKIFVMGADPVDRGVHDYFMSINIQLMELYGQSESSGYLTLNLMQRDGWKVESCGKPIEGVQLKIFNPDKNGEGEICIYGRNVFMGYLNNEEKTKEAIDDDGWLHSGDIGKIKDGFLYFIGRINAVITLSGGEKIHPEPIEKAIKHEIPFLSNVMVVGDERDYLTCLMTLKCEIDPDTGEHILTQHAQHQIHTLGSHNTNISEIVTQQDRAVFEAIQEGLDKISEDQAQRVKKWSLLEKDFSIPGGELGPTLKVRRHFVQKKYAATIDAMYSES